MYNEKDIQKLIDELDIVQVIGEYVTLRKVGSSYKGLSPFKEEKTPSFVVSPTKNIFKDFSSNIGGNVITFYMKINNLSYIEAIDELVHKYNINITRTNFNKGLSEKNNKSYKIMKEAQIYFENNIEVSNYALEYMSKRDFTINDIKKFGIGFSPNLWNGLYDYLTEKGYGTEELIELGLVRKNDNGSVYDYYRNRIMFPIYNESMRIVAFGGRQIENDENSPKYLNSPDTKIFKKGNELFGLYNRGENIRKKGLAILMEGYLDVLTAHKNGFTNSVATLGTSLTKEQVKILKKYTQNIIIAYDNDEAGKNAIVKASYILKNNDFNIRCLVINDDIKDPDEYLRKYGRKSFLEVLKQSKNIFDFLYDEFSATLNLNDISGKKEMINRFREFFVNVTNKTEANLYIQKLSVDLDLDREILLEEFYKKRNYTKKNLQYNKYTKNVLKEKVISKLPKDEKYNNLEKETLKYILKYNNSKKLEENIHCKTLIRKKFHNIIFSEILEKLKKIDFDIKNIDNLMLEEEEKEIITTLKLQSEIDIQNEEKRYKDLFIGWFLREIDYLREIINKKDTTYIKLQLLKSELKTIHNITEIEEMYNEFINVRRSDYV